MALRRLRDENLYFSQTNSSHFYLSLKFFSVASSVTRIRRDILQDRIELRLHQPREKKRLSVIYTSSG